MKLESLLDLYLVARSVERLKESGYPCEWTHEQLPGFEKVGRHTVGNARDMQTAGGNTWTGPTQTGIGAESGDANAIPE